MSAASERRATLPELQVFTRVPVAGRVKTRLIPLLGADGAMHVHRVLAERTLAAAAAVPATRRSLWFDGDATDPWLAAMQARDPELLLHAQAGADLGERMHRALVEGCAGGAGALLFGTDCPGLDAAYLGAAVRALAGGADLVLGPVEDGGYVLVGLRKPCPALFRGVPWSTADVLPTTLAIAARLGLGVAQLPMRWDVDLPPDVARLGALGLADIEVPAPGRTDPRREGLP